MTSALSAESKARRVLEQLRAAVEDALEGKPEAAELRRARRAPSRRMLAWAAMAALGCEGGEVAVEEAACSLEEVHCADRLSA